MTRRNALSALSAAALLVAACTHPAAPPPTRATQPARPAAPTAHAVRTVEGAHWIFLDEPAPLDVPYVLLHATSYDDTATAPAPRLDPPRGFTLVGPDTACAVTTDERLYVRGGSGGIGRVALVVPRDRCAVDAVVVAIADDGGDPGVVPTRARAERATGAQDVDLEVAAWVEALLGAPLWQPVGSDDPAVYREWLPGTDVEVIYAFLDRPTPGRAATLEVVLRRGDDALARLGDATVIAHLRWNAVDYAVVQPGRGAALRLVALAG